MPEKTVLMHIWREEASDEPDAEHRKDPFDGIETYLVNGDEEVAMTIVNTLAVQHPGWKFLVETASSWALDE
jgi:hypothetical protein